MKKQNFLFYLLSGLLMCGVLASCGDNSSGNNFGVPDNSSGQSYLYVVDYTLYDDNFHEVIKQVTSKVSSVSGFIYSSEESETYGYYIYKIPSEQLDSFISYVDSFAQVGSKRISSNTVSSENIQAEIDAKEARKAVLISLIADSSKTENQIAMYKVELEQLNYELDDLYKKKAESVTNSNYSVIRMSFYESPKAESEIYWGNYFSYLKKIAKALGSVLLYSAPFAGASGIAIGIAFLIRGKKKANQD